MQFIQRIVFTLIALNAPFVLASQNYAIATAHPLATEAGINILEAGGNAFDAAVAISAALAVVEPYSSGIGGGGFWLLHDGKSHQSITIDGREVAPLKAKADMFISKTGRALPKLATKGALSAAIPGEVAALSYISENYGAFNLAKNLAPAIQLAANGFEIDERFAAFLQFRRNWLKEESEFAQLLTKEGRPLVKGDRLIQRDLANTLQTIALKGRSGFYEGVVAEKLVAGNNAAGGIWQLDDLKKYQLKVRTPIKGQYHDLQITTTPPPSAGGVALLTTLNILSLYEQDPLSKADHSHLLIESWKRAYCDRASFLGDPDFVDVPDAKLISIAHAKELADDLNLNHATKSSELQCPASIARDNHTTHFSVMDDSGNRVAATLTVNHPFGSGLIPKGTGVLLNNEMDDFSIMTGVKNQFGLVGHASNLIAPLKRPLSSMTPTFFENEDGIGVIGTPGGSRIPTMVTIALLDAAQGTPVESWVAAQRYHHQYMPDVVSFEQGGLSSAMQNALRLRGHKVEPLAREYGNMQAVYFDKRTKLFSSASDKRGVGLAVAKNAS